MKLVYTLLLFAFAPALTQAQDLLSYTLNPGDLFVVRQEASQVITQEIGDSSHEINNNITGLMEFKVIERTNNGYSIAMVFKDLSMMMISSQHGELLNVVASQVKEGDAQSKIFNSMLNVPILLELAGNGEVLKVSGGDSLVQRMVSASGIEDEFSRSLMEKSLEKEFGSEALSDSYEQMTYFYPREAIKIGDSWENDYFGKLTAHNQWTLDSLDARTAGISGKAEVKINLEEQATTMNLSGTQVTTITTDRLSGFMTEMMVESFTKGVSILSQMGGQEIPTSIKSTITYQLIQ